MGFDTIEMNLVLYCIISYLEVFLSFIYICEPDCGKRNYAHVLRNERLVVMTGRLTAHVHA